MSDKEFRIFVVTKLTEMEEKRDKELQEMRKSFHDLKEEIYTLNKNQMELLGLKNVIQEIKTSLESIKSRSDQAEDQISNVEDKTSDLEKSIKKIEKTAMKNEDNIQGILDTIKRPNIQILGIPEEEENNKGLDNLFHEILEENFPNLERHSNIQTQEIHRTPTRTNPRRSSPRHIIARLAKTIKTRY